MPLDPQAKAALEFLNQPEMRLDAAEWPTEARNSMVLPPPENPEQVARVEDISIDGPGGDLPLRLYHPGDPDGEHPPALVLYFHGGGFVFCNLDTHDALCRTLCNSTGAAILSVDYRLAPEAKFPAAPEDCYAALCWGAANSEQLDIDAGRIAVAGDSAGGNLAAVTALMSRDRGGPTLRSQVLIYPVTSQITNSPSYTENGEGYFLTQSGMEYCINHYLNSPEDKQNPLASPLLSPDLSSLPPAVVVTAEYDPLRDEGENYGRRLAEAEVPVWMRRYDGMIHGFVSMGDMMDRGKEALADISEQLRVALAPTSA